MPPPPDLSVGCKLVIRIRSCRPGRQYNVIIICDQTLPVLRRRLAAVTRKPLKWSQKHTRRFLSQAAGGLTPRGQTPTFSRTLRGQAPLDPDVWPQTIRASRSALTGVFRTASRHFDTLWDTAAWPDRLKRPRRTTLLGAAADFQQRKILDISRCR